MPATEEPALLEETVETEETKEATTEETKEEKTEETKVEMTEEVIMVMEKEIPDAFPRLQDPSLFPI